MRIYNELLEGLEYIHSRRIVHRDIKPDNIWVPDDPGRPPFYLDFGISVETGTEAIYQGTEHYKPTGVYGKAAQTEDLNYYALGTIFHDNPVPNSNLGVNLRNRSLRPANVVGKRFSRRRRSRRSRSRRAGRRQNLNT
jgi:serine/threonine protein kinase